jgi:phytoene/squalene synthetase
VNVAKNADYPTYLTGLLLPASSKRAYFALAAFNANTSNIKSLKSDNSPGQLRMAWWRERIADLFENTLESKYKSQPILSELQPAIQTHGLTRRFFEQILDARQDDLTVQTHSDLTALEKYIVSTQTPLLKLSLETVGVKNDDADHVASHLGMALGLSNFIRSIHHLAEHNIVALPNDILKKHMISSNALLKPERNTSLDDDAVRAAVFDLAVVGNEHLHHARDMFHKSPVPPEAKSVLLRGVDVAMFYKALEECDFDVHRACVKKGGLDSLPVQLAKHKYFNSDPF